MNVNKPRNFYENKFHNGDKSQSKEEEVIVANVDVKTVKRLRIVVAVPKYGGARASVQSSAFLSGKCMARDVLARAAALRRALVAAADALRPRRSHL